MTPSDFEAVSSSLPIRRSSQGSRDSTADALKAEAQRRRASTLSKRRSVTGMTGLMPLSLGTPSTAPSAPASIRSIQQPAMASSKVDGYFPEALARDLELSNAVFAARNMSPTPEDIPRSMSAASQRASSPYFTGSLRVQSLGPIEERNSVVSFLEKQRLKYDDSASDLDSMSGTDASGAAVPPSFRYRQQSIVTAATSVTSHSQEPSPKRSLSMSVSGQRDYSWIEPNSDDEDSEDNTAADDHGSLSPRPPTPPAKDQETYDRLTSATPVTKRSPWTRNNTYHQKAHSMSHSTGRSSPAPTSSRRLSNRSVDTTRQRANSAQSRGGEGSIPSIGRRRSTQPSEARRSSKSQQHLARSTSTESRPRTARTDGSSKLHRPEVIKMRALAIDTRIDTEEDDTAQRRRPTPKSSVRPSTATLPLPAVKSWGDGNAQIWATPLPSEDVGRAVPLPPDAMETLRVSVACFPETMLLSSSLTVDTIRQYSKKLRHTSVDLFRTPESPQSSSKRSIWKKGFFSRQNSFSSDYRSHDMSMPSPTSSQFPSPGTAVESKPWMPLKHVFGAFASDYICDSLYAHVVAYNYISTLVPRATQDPQLSAGRGKGEKEKKLHEEIPRKAASLLGLSSAAKDVVPVPKLARKLSQRFATLGSTKEGHVSASALHHHNDAAARDLQAGLLRCISRLVTTAKTMADSGNVDERIAELDLQLLDVLFIRSLCEIVRISEEAAGL